MCQDDPANNCRGDQDRTDLSTPTTPSARDEVSLHFHYTLRTAAETQRAQASTLPSEESLSDGPLNGLCKLHKHKVHDKTQQTEAREQQRERAHKVCASISCVQQACRRLLGHRTAWPLQSQSQVHWGTQQHLTTLLSEILRNTIFGKIQCRQFHVVT